MGCLQSRLHIVPCLHKHANPNKSKLFSCFCCEYEAQQVILEGQLHTNNAQNHYVYAVKTKPPLMNHGLQLQSPLYNIYPNELAKTPEDSTSNASCVRMIWSCCSRQKQAAAAAPGSAVNFKRSKQWSCAEMIGTTTAQNGSFNLAVNDCEDKAR